MHSLHRVIIIASEQSGESICQLLSRTDLEVVALDPGVADAYELARADMVIEALVGEMEERKKIHSWCDKTMPSKAVLATTWPSGITEMAASTKRPHGFVGLHFTFNPFQDRCVVQIVKSLETSHETLEACTTLIKKTGATAIQVTDFPGLVLDRVMALMINEAATMCVARVAAIEDIDRVARSCLNWPVGPFEFADIIGIDRVLAILDTLSREVAPRFLPCRLLRQMKAMGRLGKKTNRGFYDYR